MKKVLFLNVFAGLSLLACMNNNTSPENQGPTGTARIRFPVVPATSVVSGAKMIAPEYMFTVTVAGSGMTARTQTWKASEFSGKTVVLEDIPSGPSRVFTGTMRNGSTKTHEGSFTADIGGGESVFVPLVLRDVRTGRAEICVEVEGWPGSPDCTPIDTLPQPVDGFDIQGCWRLQARDRDTSLSGTLHIFGFEGTLQGSFRADDGRQLFVNFNSVNGGLHITLIPWIPFDDNQVRTNSFVYPAPPDTLSWSRYYLNVNTDPLRDGSMHHTHFNGQLMNESFQVKRGEFTATETECDSIGIDDPVDTTWIYSDTTHYLNGSGIK